jgi:adenine/guanine/hypoxanthine permease
MGTMTAIGAEAGLLDEEGIPPNTERILVVDSLAAAAGGVAGVSSNTSYIESASGVGEGARTGLASVVTGALFLLAIFLAPIAGLIPAEATAPALILVGFLMASIIRDIDFSTVDDGLPALLTLAVMPFTFSITDGVGAGFVMYSFLKLVTARAARSTGSCISSRRPLSSTSCWACSAPGSASKPHSRRAPRAVQRLA